MKGRGSNSYNNKKDLDEFGQYIDCKNKILVLNKNKEYGLYESDDETSEGTSKVFSQEKYLNEQLHDIEIKLDQKRMERENMLSPNDKKIRNYFGMNQNSDGLESRTEKKLLNPFASLISKDTFSKGDNIFGGDSMFSKKRKQTFS